MNDRAKCKKEWECAKSCCLKNDVKLNKKHCCDKKTSKKCKQNLNPEMKTRYDFVCVCFQKGRFVLCGNFRSVSTPKPSFGEVSGGSSIHKKHL
eukprot:TRINITY_DN1671_c0_g1_i1.p1 TRINITY_DN1671_c0_g1~~TRINITY_DN1671_c0_g1_i1.p1  ORF type:complete len:94 (+),score=13.45 TRINITY_DN1671_c0_g1_i1:215-496(+)